MQDQALLSTTCVIFVAKNKVGTQSMLLAEDTANGRRLTQSSTDRGEFTYGTDDNRKQVLMNLV